MKEKTLLKIIGLFFIILSVVNIVGAYRNNSQLILWFCYSGIFLMGLGMLLNERILIESQILILAIPNIIWTIDFFSNIVGIPLFGITNYFFASGPILTKILTMQHLFTVPLALIFSFNIEQKWKRSWIVSLIQVYITYGIVYFFTKREHNINCVFTFCGSYKWTLSYYPILWFITVFLMIYLTHFLLVRAGYYNNKKV